MKPKETSAPFPLKRMASWLGQSSWPVLVSQLSVCTFRRAARGRCRMWPLKARPRLGRQVWTYTGCSPVPSGGGNPVKVCLFNSDLSPLSSSNQILSCGQPAATGSAWMDSLRRPHRPRVPGRRPIPTLGTAPSLPPQAQNQAAGPVGPTLQACPGR